MDELESLIARLQELIDAATGGVTMHKFLAVKWCATEITLPYPSPLAIDAMRLLPQSAWRVFDTRQTQSADERAMHQLRAVWQLKMRLLGLAIDEQREKALRNKARRKVTG